MKILVTGANGFIGKNLITKLREQTHHEIYPCDVDTTSEELDVYLKDCDFVYHLAGVNRPKDVSEFMVGNFGFLNVLLEGLKRHGNTCPIMNSSSIQAKLPNPYGESKKAGEDALIHYGIETGSRIYIYRFPNAFGKWSRPNYNSVVSTFCYNIARNLPIQVNDDKTELTLVYIDDIVEELIKCLEGNANINEDGFCSVAISHTVSLGDLVNILQSFHSSRSNLELPALKNESLEKKLYSTYLSYLPEHEFSYPLTMHTDERGSFTEILRTLENGQFSVNISKPGVVKGNHYHHTKTEKFVVVSGNALFQFRKLGSKEVISYHVSSDKIEVVDIPPGYTHSIVNEGATDLVTFVWSNECFNPERPDTFYEEIYLGDS